ncbi:hypothetical protein MELB17_03697 [Marinobacter sp. ELB17]|nr:hypothetical protein MELB17_03697 [Marinobacter sp. ELB17]
MLAVKKTAASTAAAVDIDVMIQYFLITHIVGIAFDWHCVVSAVFGARWLLYIINEGGFQVGG